jgi:hypothetical protein
MTSATCNKSPSVGTSSQFDFLQLNADGRVGGFGMEASFLIYNLNIAVIAKVIHSFKIHFVI